MSHHGPPYVVSQDVGLLLGSLAKPRNLELPSSIFLNELRREMAEELQRYFPESDIKFVGETHLQEGLITLAKSHRNLNTAIVSLDRVYFHGDPMTTLDTTRMHDPISLEASKALGSRTTEPLDAQFDRVFQTLRSRNITGIELLDDVVFSSGSIGEVVNRFHAGGFRVTDILSGIMITKAKSALRTMFPGIEVASVLEYEDVIDEICERDFYLGVPLSGHTIGKDGISLVPEEGAPYFLPCGDAHSWASIPKEHEQGWSSFCIRQSIKLWREVERLSGRVVHCRELPRKPRNIPWSGSAVECMEQLLLVAQS